MNALGWLSSLAGIVALALGTAPAWAQKKYDPGANDTTIMGTPSNTAIQKYMNAKPTRRGPTRRQ